MDKISRKPEIPGTQGQAWRINLTKLREFLKVEPGNDGTVAMWIVEAAFAHPIWHSYVFVLLHLRPIGLPTKIYLEGATHEFWIQALDPDKPREPAIEGKGMPYYLTPNNFAAQFIAADDGKAIERVENAIKKVVAGELSPDTDYIRHWAHLFGDNMMLEGAGETRILINANEDLTGADLQIVIPPKPGPQDLH
jgi:hypothetical protein